MAVLWGLLKLLLFSFIAVKMADVGIEIVGDLSTPNDLTNLKPSNFLSSINVKTLGRWFQSSRESIRPWGEFVNTTNFKLPPSFQRLIKRAVNNIKYFEGNYVVISLVLMAYSLLTSPMLLIAVFVSLLACYMLSLRHKEKKLVIGGKEVTLNQQYGLVGICSVPLYYWAGATEAVVWVVVATCFVVSLHAGLYNIEAILKDDEQLEVLLDQI